MNNKKFKIGDNVRIIKCSTIESYELNKIGTIVDICGRTTYIVNMGRPRRKKEPNEFCWWLQGNMIELASKPNEQLLFEFMY